MTSGNSAENEFINKLTEITEANLDNPQFGVSWLAREMRMSRTNLHRKVNSIAKISVSQFIRHIRLNKAKEILRHTSDTISEVAYKVGFNNVSYFIKCFHEYFGYSPGEVGNRESDENDSTTPNQINKRWLTVSLTAAILFVILAVVLILVFKPFSSKQKELEKTITITPPYYESQDSSVVKIINGSIQNIIDNLNLIKDINCTPWISVVKYKNVSKSAPEIALETGVNYVIQPSVLSYEGKVQLKIPIVEGQKDIQINSYLYDININDVTSLYQKISKEIAQQINAQITPEEQYKIEKQITQSGKALNYYNEGVDFINLWRMGAGLNNVDSAITSFKKALDYDITCASAYAQIARMFYIKDYRWNAIFLNVDPEKLYKEQIYNYAEKAFFYDSDLDLSLLAKGLYNQYTRDYDLAKLYFKKALEYNPNSSMVLYYSSYIYEETGELEKFLEYAVKAVNSDFIAKNISGELRTEIIYYRIAKAYRSLGFFEKALEYLDLAIKINPDLTDAVNEKSQVIQDLNGDYPQSIELLLKLAQKDSSNQNTFRFLGLAYYILRDYPNASNYYKKMLILRDKLNMRGERDAGRLSIVFSNTGETEKVYKYINEYYDFANKQTPKRKSYFLIGYYTLTGNIEKAIEQIKIFSTYNFYDYSQIRMLKNEPMYDKIKNLPEFQELLLELETKYRANHERIKADLKSKGLL